MRNSILKSSNYKWYVFFAMATGSLTNVIHHGAVSIALPTLAKEFDVSLTIIQWVVLAEALTISSMLLPMGKLSDTIGRKPMYLGMGFTCSWIEFKRLIPTKNVRFFF